MYLRLVFSFLIFFGNLAVYYVQAGSFSHPAFVNREQQTGIIAAPSPNEKNKIKQIMISGQQQQLPGPYYSQQEDVLSEKKNKEFSQGYSSRHIPLKQNHSHHSKEKSVTTTTGGNAATLSNISFPLRIDEDQY
eukprot:jgi/Bigna1/80289/fgenesh1_pg.69_\